MATIIGKIDNDKKWLALLKTIGYSNSMIFRLLLTEMFVFLGAGLIVSLIASLCIIRPLFVRMGIIETGVGTVLGNISVILFLFLGAIMMTVLACVIARARVKKVSATILLKE